MSALGISTDNIDVIISDSMAKCIETIKTNSRAAGQVATGKTLRSLEYTLQRLPILHASSEGHTSARLRQVEVLTTEARVTPRASIRG